MNGRTLGFLLGTVLIAVVIGWRLAFPSTNQEARVAALAAAKANAFPPTPSTAAPKPPAAPDGWVPPTGEPVERYRAARTAEERMKIISDFITLGHDRNVNMLKEAVNDSVAKVRMLALESAASMLAPEQASEVYRVSGRSSDADIRTMTWSFLAPHPMENRVKVYGEVLQKGPDVAVEETLSEMGRTPELPLFETMLFEGQSKDMAPNRSDRLLKELNQWLKPGGGSVPEFHSMADLQAWWQANRQRYDQFMLRLDL